MNAPAPKKYDPVAASKARDAINVRLQPIGQQIKLCEVDLLRAAVDELEQHRRKAIIRAWKMLTNASDTLEALAPIDFDCPF